MLWRRILKWVLFSLFWLLLVFRTDLQDIVAAVILGLFTVIGIQIGARHLQQGFALPSCWARALARLPWKIIADTGRVFLALFRQIVRRDREVGRLVKVPFDYGSDGPEDVTRLALTLFAISVTPNTVPIKTASGGLLVHQLLPTSEEAARRDPRWPA